MSDEIPYALYLRFKKPTPAVTLILSLESLELLCLGEERIDGSFSIVHYHFKNDAGKKAVLHVEIEDNCSERINISLYQGVSAAIIAELFLFLKNFDAGKTALIDQEIKNELYIRDLDSFRTNAKATVISDDWMNAAEKQATLSVDLADFYKNATGNLKRGRLLGN